MHTFTYSKCAWLCNSIRITLYPDDYVLWKIHKFEVFSALISSRHNCHFRSALFLSKPNFENGCKLVIHLFGVFRKLMRFLVLYVYIYTHRHIQEIWICCVCMHVDMSVSCMEAVARNFELFPPQTLGFSLSRSFIYIFILEFHKPISFVLFIFSCSGLSLNALKQRESVANATKCK